MLHEGRVGSTALARTLNSDPMLAHHGELLEPGVWVHRGFEGTEYFRLRENRAISINKVFEYFKYCETSHPMFKNKTPRVYSFELKFNHIDQLGICITEAINQLLSLGYELVFLCRKNVLRRIVSNERALITNVWHINRTDANNSNGKQTVEKFALNVGKVFCPYLSNSVPLDKAIKNSVDMQFLLQSFAGHTEGVHFLLQEDIDKQTPGYLALLTDVFKTEVDQDSSLLRTNPSQLRQMLDNYLEVKSSIPSFYHWMLKN